MLMWNTNFGTDPAFIANAPAVIPNSDNKRAAEILKEDFSWAQRLAMVLVPG
ncbi:MAG: hypothetical protein QXK73_06955 [Candidatus Bathyarchaeia archaeon]